MSEAEGNIGNIVSAFSAIAAWVAAFFAYRASQIAKKSLTLAEIQEEKRKPHLVPYLSEGFTCKVDGGAYRAYAFSVSLSNRSEVENALARAELVISYRHENNLLASAVLTHTSQKPIGFPFAEIVPIELPVHINIRHTISGWFIFKIKRDQLKNSIIEGYKIKIYDTQARETSITPIIIKDIVDENEITKA